jgi:hypothetical protein
MKSSCDWPGMKRRRVLSMFAAAMAGGLSLAHGSPVKVVPLPLACRSAAVIARVTDIRSEEVVTPLGECGLKMQGRVVRVLAGTQSETLAWRGRSSFEQSPSQVVFATLYPLESLLADEGARLEPQELESVRQLIAACSPLQSALVVTQAYPVLAGTGGDAVWLGSDRQQVEALGANLDPSQLRWTPEGATIGLPEFEALIRKFRASETRTAATGERAP